MGFTICLRSLFFSPLSKSFFEEFNQNNKTTTTIFLEENNLSELQGDINIYSVLRFSKLKDLKIRRELISVIMDADKFGELFVKSRPFYEFCPTDEEIKFLMKTISRYS